MGIGQRPLDRPLAKPGAEESALADGVFGIGQLRVGLDLGRQESVDPPRHMLDRRIGQDPAPRDDDRDQTEDPDRRPGDEIDHHPGKEDQRPLSVIGLHHQEPHDNHHHDQRQRLAGGAVDLLAGGDHPGGEDHEDGFQEFRGLHRRKSKRIPARRALPVIGAKDRQQCQRGEGPEKAEHAKAAHLLRAHHRGEDHGHESQPAEERLPVDIVERIEPVARGQGRRGGEAKQQSDQEKSEDTGQRDPIDGPPPPRQNRLARLHKYCAMRHFRHGFRPILPLPVRFCPGSGASLTRNAARGQRNGTSPPVGRTNLDSPPHSVEALPQNMGQGEQR